MLKATEEEIEEVREYFEWQAPDLEVTFMQKVYSEAVMNTRHDVWDIHTNKDRWWVITGGTNLYSQEQFPNMDLALTFHIGLILRIPHTEEQQEDDLRILPFGPVFEKMEEAGTAVTQAQNLADYQTRCRRCHGRVHATRQGRASRRRKLGLEPPRLPDSDDVYPRPAPEPMRELEPKPARSAFEIVPRREHY